MTQYIDKAVVVAEINRVLNSYDPNEITSGRYALVSLRDFLDTLEVKEVDLKKELQSFFYRHVPWGDYCKNEQKDIEEWSFKIAKHFFELGLKAMKGGEQ